jgi:hypothetical protein
MYYKSITSAYGRPFVFDREQNVWRMEERMIQYLLPDTCLRAHRSAELILVIGCRQYKITVILNRLFGVASFINTEWGCVGGVKQCAIHYHHY